MQIKTKKRLAAALCAALLIALPACQEDPDGSIVANKDMEKLISEGAESGESRVDAGELIEDAGKAENYKTDIDSQKLKVKIDVDATVELPETDKLSIYRVRQKPFDQELLDKVRAELCGDATLYDGEATRTRVKRDIEEEIQFWRNEMAQFQAALKEHQNMAESPEGFTKEDVLEWDQNSIDSAQETIDRLQEEYESAPSEIIFTDFPTDGKIHTVKELYERNTESSYYSWLNSLSIDGDTGFYGVSDGSDGSYKTLYVQNNADYSNQLIYRNDLEQFADFGILIEDTALVPYIEPRALGLGVSFEEFYKQHGVPGNVLPDGMVYDGLDVTFTPLGSETVELSEDEAKAQAQDLLTKLGLTDFTLDEGGLYTEMEFERYKVNYIFKYRRAVDGVMLTQSSGGKFQYGDANGSFNKQMWPGECIEIRVSDRGIVGFRYNAPLEVTETVVDGATMKGFDEIKGVFEQMTPIVLADDNFEYKAKVDRVRLSYSRISEKDSFDTGLIVPVWSFEGEVQAYDPDGYPMQRNTGTIIAINAIDGSVIDAELGY